MKDKLANTIMVLMLMSPFFIAGFEKVFPEYTPWDVSNTRVQILGVQVEPMSTLILITSG
ncbi:hypothetical protein C0583_05295 [Candidatus Parcubacteria bacterium]|nr:MAG: hypothetical protein C0583_05295 [Candidatus Parcubacteria bacterium]